MANLTIKIKVDDSAVSGLAKTLQSAIDGIEFKMDKTQLNKLSGDMQNAFKDIEIDIDTSGAMRKIEAFQSSVSELKSEMADMKIGFSLENLNAKDIIGQLNKQTKDGMEVKALQDYKKQLLETNELRKQLKRGNNLDPHTKAQYKTQYNEMKIANERTEKLFNEQFNAKLNQRKEMADFHKDLDREYREYDPSIASEERSKTANDYMKEYQRNLKEVSKYQKEMDKSEPGTRSHEAASNMVNALRAEQNVLEASLKDLKVDIDTDDATSSLKNLLKLQEEVVRAATDDKKNTQSLRELGDIEKERAKLLQDSEKARAAGRTNESTELKAQADLKQLNIELAKSDDMYKNLSTTQKQAFDESQSRTNKEVADLKRINDAKQQDADTQAKLKQQAADYKELEKATEDYYKTANKVAELQAKMDKETNTAKDGEKLIEAKALADAQKAQMDGLKNGLSDMKQYEEAYKSMTDARDKSLDTNTKMQQDTQSQVADLRRVEDAYKQIEQSIREVDRLERAKDGAGQAEVQALDKQISAQKELQAEIRTTNNLRENGVDSLEKQGQQLEENLAKTRQNERDVRIARGSDNYKPHRAPSLTGGLFDTGRIIPTIDVMDVARETVQSAKYIYNGVADVDKSLVQVRKVVDATDQEWTAFADGIYDNASEVGKSATEYAGSVGKWAQAGKDMQEAQRLAKISNIGAFVGELSEDQMIDYMSVPLNAFAKEGLEAHNILNAMNEVANNNAVEMDHLGAAYTRAAQTAALSGTSFSELTGLIGAAQESTRLGGETIGTSLRQMDVNIGRIATQSTKGLEKKFDFFKDIGVDITDTNGEIRSTFDILQDLEGVWDNLDSVTQRQAAIDLAGSRGQAVMSGLMGNWESVMKMMDEADGQMGFGEGMGSAYDEFAIQADSLQYKAIQVENAWREFLNTVSGGSDTFKGMFDIALDGIDKLTKFTQDENAMDFTASIATMLGTGFATKLGTQALTSFSTNLMDTGKSMVTFGDKGKMFSKTSTVIGKGIGGLGKAAGKLSSVLGYAGLAAEVFFLADAVGELFGLDLSGMVAGWATSFGNFVKKGINPLNASMLEHIAEQDRLSKSIADNPLMNGEIAGANKAIRAYAELGIAKENAYAITGDSSELQWDTTEFEGMATEFNAMIDALDLDQDLKITWNNHSHIMRQIEALKREIHELAKDSGYQGLRDISDMYENRVTSEEVYKNWMDRNDRNNTYKNAREVETRMMDDSTYGPNAQVTDEQKRENTKRGQIAFYDNLLDFASSAFMADLVPQIKQQDIQIKKNTQDLMKNFVDATSGTDFSDLLNTFFGDFDSTDEGATASFVAAARQAGQYADTVEKASGAQDQLNTYMKDFVNSDGVVTNLEEAGAAAIAFGEYLDKSGLIDDSRIVSLLDGKDLTDLDLSQLNELMSVISSIKTESQSAQSEVELALRGLADQYGLTAENIDTLMQSYGKNTAEYVGAVMESSKALGEQLFFDGMGGTIETLSMGLEVDSSDAYTGAQAQLDGMELELPVKMRMGLTEKDGFLEGDVFADMLRLQTLQEQMEVEFGVTFGYDVTGEDSLNQYMDILSVSDDTKTIIQEMGIELKYDAVTGMIDMDSLIKAITSGEITAEQVVQLEAVLANDGAGVDQVVQQVEGQIKGAVSGTSLEAEYMVKFTPNFTDTEQNPDYIKDKLIAIVQEADGFDAEVWGNIVVDGKIDTARLADALSISNLDQGLLDDMTQGVIEYRKTIGVTLDPEYDILDDGGIDMTELTDYMYHLSTTQGEQAVIDFMVKILPRLFPGAAEEAGAVVEDFADEMPDEITNEVGMETTVEAHASLSGGNGLDEVVNQIEQDASSRTVTAKFNVQAEAGPVGLAGIGDLTTSLGGLGGTSFTPVVDVDTSLADAGVTAVSATLDALSARTASVMVTANILSALLQIAIVNAIIIPPKTVQIRGNAEHFNSVMNGLSGKSVTVAINGKSNKSTSITQGIGSLMSVGIGSAMNGTGINRSSAIGTNRSTASETKVNEDTWRYWAQQMYTGDPISNSMDKLSSELKSAGDDYAQIIKLTEQQIRLTKQQISHEEEMRRLEQTEMNEILASLRKEGFTTSGNRITNLDRAKTFEGDKASEVETLLNDWKGLYESIDSLDSTLAGLRADIVGFEKDIIDARKDIESDALEKQLKRSEALLKSIDNNTEIQSQRVSALDEYDFEFSVLVNENAILSSSQAIQQLIAEFNKLSLTSFEFDENAEDMYDHLEDVKGQILDNADAVLEYRNALNEIRITSLIDSFDKFTEAASRNTDTIQTNVDRLREGLLSGQGLSELGIFGGADFSQKSQFERDFEERLALEERLNEVLQNYSDTNIERTRKASNAELQIQRDKYSQLIDMARDYSTGNLGESYGVGKQQQANEEFNDRQSELVESMDKYTERYQAMISRYNVALTQAGNTAQRQALYNNLIIEQLKLQEEYQYEIIAQNKEAIAQAQLLASNTSLTTSQKRELLDSVNEYQQNIVDAQQNIRDSIATRFEFEFELMDEATARYQDYYESLQYALEIAKITNVSASSLGKFYESIYGSLISQYDLAKRQLQELTAEQSKFENGSYEWELLAARIKETTQTVRDLGLEALNSNKDILDNTLDSLTNFFEKGFLDGATLEEWENYHKNWITGVEKELALEELRVKSLSMEDDVIRRRLEALDRQDEVSRKELEYLDKQMKLSELEAKLENIEGERDVQTLTRRDDGTWGWDYVADQSEYESTQKEMLEAQKALEEFRREQRGSYVSSLGDIIGRAKDGAYDSPEDLQNDLNLLNAVYGSILSDIPGFQNMSLDDVVKAYQKYMADNAILAGDMMGDPTLTTPESQAIGLVSESFVASFMSVSSELGKIIGAELRAALGLTTDGTMLNNSGVVYNVANVELPNVTDGEGFANFFRDLPVVAEQQATVK